MSVILITGIPGSGKTLFAVSRLKKELEKNLALPDDEQRKVYCDITGLKIENIDKPPMDWRETPNKSLLIYDEAQFHEEFKPAKGLSKYKQVEELTIHRKTGHEIWFITQDPNRLHGDILAMVEQHFHLERPYGAKLATIYQYRGAEKFAKRPTVKARAERASLFYYDKSLYELYESSEVEDGIKFRLPVKLVWWALVLVGIVGFTLTSMFSEDTTKHFKTAETTKTAEKPKNDLMTGEIAGVTDKKQLTTTASSVKPMPPVETAETEDKRVAMVFATNTTCVAKNRYGEILYQNDVECLAYANRTKQMNFSRLDYTANHSHNVQNTPIIQGVESGKGL